MRKITTVLATLAALSLSTAGCESGTWEPAKSGDSIAIPPPPKNSVERDDMIDAFADDEPEAAPTGAPAAVTAPAAASASAAPAASGAPAKTPAKKAAAPATKPAAPAKKK